VSFTIASIVEGHGDEPSLPLLLRRLLPTARVARPVRFPKTLLLTDEGLKRAVAIARANIRHGEFGMVLLVIDADEDCAAELGPTLLDKVRASAHDVDCFVALAVHEFESWIVGGHPDIDVEDPESAGKPKDRIAQVNSGRYKETVDQPRFTAAIDPDRLRARSPSFRRLIERLEAIPKDQE
jgi:hypothetical protein